MRLVNKEIRWVTKNPKKYMARSFDLAKQEPPKDLDKLVEMLTGPLSGT